MLRKRHPLENFEGTRRRGSVRHRHVRHCRRDFFLEKGRPRSDSTFVFFFRVEGSFRENRKKKGGREGKKLGIFSFFQAFPFV